MKREFHHIGLLSCLFSSLLLLFSPFVDYAYSTPSSYYDTIQKVYIGYYQRPADPAGLIYWAERLNASNGNLNDIIDAFANSMESQGLYGIITSGSISNVVHSIYLTLFNRDADEGGRNYYVSSFNVGEFPDGRRCTAGTIVLDILNGAVSSDLQSINNKLTAANLFTRTIDPDLDGGNFQATYSGDGDAIAGRNFLALYATASNIPTQAETTTFIRNYIADPADPIMPSVVITLGNTNGRSIAPLLGVNAGPTPQGDAGNVDVTSQYKSIGVSAVRTHDFYGPMDMSVMYPDRTRNPQLDSSYNFSSSDTAYDAIISGGFEPYLRIGDSYNNVTPPVNLIERINWAAAAVHITGRYLGRGSFRYVEVGNEPDFAAQFWPPPRTQAEFFDLYVRTAMAIKTAYPTLKVGGPGVTQNAFKTTDGKKFLNDFLAYVKNNGAPLDFLSWHCYSNDPADYSQGAAYIRQQLDAYGFTTAENHNSEWNSDDVNGTPQEVRLEGRGAAIITGSWISLVKGGISQSLFFRGNDTSMNLPTFYGLMFADGTYKRNALAFSLWSRLTSYPAQLNLTATSTNDLSQLQTLAGENTAGQEALLIANLADTPLTATVNGMSLPLKVRVVSNASAALQESTQTSSQVSIPAYSALLITSNGL